MKKAYKTPKITEIIFLGAEDILLSSGEPTVLSLFDGTGTGESLGFGSFDFTSTGGF